MSEQHTTTRYLPAGLPIPVPEPDGLSAPYWQALRENRLLVQRCARCGTYQFGPEWLCHGCHAFDPAWVEVVPHGRIYSWERIWHPSHDALNGHGPYLAVLVELPHAGYIRMIGNLLGDPLQPVIIGAEVEGVFEHHLDAQPPYSLLQWRLRRPETP
ncbi:Zn-ribbon domain-containing OB-fold protein [Burkholderia territorii]|uniref:Zn-ribbon domain-containing OB-fold protein n=1 Tax=Burkholderia territorii TaxID=1503055 RepID=UPI0009C16364|nr:zinc ribbon domain-containing protein [Burkholderia territorii]